MTRDEVEADMLAECHWSRNSPGVVFT